MPAFPIAVQRILELTSDINCNPRDLVEVLDHDPILTLKILKVANSAYFGVATEIVSVRHAVVYLGLNTVKHIGVSIAAVGVMPTSTPGGVCLDSFLIHALRTAVIAKKLAGRLGVSPIHCQNHFVAGLLHDIGQIVLAHYQPTLYRQVLDRVGHDDVSLLDAETEFFGGTHCDHGGQLASKWNLSQELVEAIATHHSTEGGEHLNAMRDCVYIANQLAHPPSNAPDATDAPDAPQDLPEPPLPERLQERFRADLEALRAYLGDIEDELSRAQSFVNL